MSPGRSTRRTGTLDQADEAPDQVGEEQLARNLQGADLGEAGVVDDGSVERAGQAQGVERKQVGRRFDQLEQPATELRRAGRPGHAHGRERHLGVRHELGTVSANRHLAQQQHAKLNRSHEELRDQIAQALGAQRDDLARAAVSRQIDIEAQIPVLETTLADLARQEQELQGFTAALLAKKREMQEALAEFRKSRAATESAAQPAGQANVEQRLGKVADAFDKIYQRQTGLDGTQQAASLEQAARLSELEQLVRDHKIAERRAQIKAGQA